MRAHDNTDKYGRNWCWVGAWQHIPKPKTLIKVRPHDVSNCRLVQIVMPPSPLIFLNEPWPLVYDAQVWIKNGMVFKFIKSNKRSDFVRMSSKINSFTGYNLCGNQGGLCIFKIISSWFWGGISLLLGNQIQWSQWLWVCPQMGHILSWNSKTNWIMINMLFNERRSVRPPAYRLWFPRDVECGQTISQLGGFWCFRTLVYRLCNKQECVGYYE